MTLNVTETPELNNTLEVGQQTEQVTVEATAETLQTQSSTLGTVAGTAEVTGLPLSNRNYTQILSLAAGANAAVNDARSLGKGTQDMSVNGNSPGSNNFQMDGVAINSIAHPDTANDVNIYAGIGIPSPDAIQEFKVQTSTYDASYGRNPGANVNVLTKSGSNQFHGDAFEFFRNADLDANDFFYNRDTCSTSVRRAELSAPSFEYEPVRRHHRRTDQEGQDLLFRQLRRNPREERRGCPGLYRRSPASHPRRATEAHPPVPLLPQRWPP